MLEIYEGKDMVIDSLRAGKKVFVEKLLCYNEIINTTRARLAAINSLKEWRWVGVSEG